MKKRMQLDETKKIEDTINDINKSCNSLEFQLQNSKDQNAIEHLKIILDSCKAIQNSLNITNSVDEYKIQESDIQKPPGTNSLVKILYLAASRKIPKSVKFHIPKSDIFVFGDFYKLTTIFTHLFENAVDAMNKVGEIKVRVKKLSSEVIVEIEDSGPGIPKEVYSHYIQNKIYTTKPNGTGVGFKTVKTILESIGGEITIHNNPTTIKIKLSRNNTIDLAGESINCPRCMKKRILYI